MTTKPQTLRQIAGAPDGPAPLSDSVLVLIDHQMEYVTGGLPLAGMAAAVAEARALLALARTQGVPVFHVVHHGRIGGPLFDPSGPGVPVIPDLAPTEGEAVVVKSLPNAFAGTELHQWVRETGRTSLIVAGFATHMCVSSTVRAALELGYRTTVVAAATATRDLSDPVGGVVPADAVQRAELAALADRFAVVVCDTTAWR
jgi:nicotinamidase-related amidase